MTTTQHRSTMWGRTPRTGGTTGWTRQAGTTGWTRQAGTTWGRAR